MSYAVGDRVELVEDFNNYPGVILAGSQGTVTASGTSTYGYIYVRFDFLPEHWVESHTIESNRIDGLPMCPEEIKKI